MGNLSLPDNPQGLQNLKSVFLSQTVQQSTTNKVLIFYILSKTEVDMEKE